MLFAGLISAYIVRRAEGQWVHFELPSAFYLSTGLVLITSILLYTAQFQAKKNRIGKLRLFLGLGTVTGLSFIASQFLGFSQLVDKHIYMVGNVSGSFMYAITGIHALHVLGGVIALILAIVAAWRYRIHSRRMLHLELTTTYWHFIDALWVYLFVFFLALH
jgi:cytochrome c oxidase subunit 3